MPIPVPGRVAEDLRRASVQILTEGTRQLGSGSGVVLPQARVLTNAHVIRGSRVSVQSWEGETLSATVLKTDARRDLAVLSVSGLRAPSASLGDSGRLRAGTTVFAVGNPFGFVGAVSSGIIHAIGPLRFGNRGRWDLPWIQADIRLAPGNSGGPLATFDGQVIGLNTMVISGGLSLAVPSRSASAFLARMDDGPLLGFTVRSIETRAGDFGLLVLEVDAGGAAEFASLLPGDIIVGANQAKFRYAEDLENALLNATGDSFVLDFRRGGSTSVRHVAVQLRRGGLSSAA